jgi:hypothetical protein
VRTTRTVAKNVVINQERKEYQLLPALVPDTLDLSAELIRSLSDVGSKLAMFPPTDWERFFASLLACYEASGYESISPAVSEGAKKLRHPLGERAIERLLVRPQFCLSSQAEKIVLDQTRAEFEASLCVRNASDFITVLTRISALSRGEAHVDLRRSGVTLSGDKLGWRWRFPDRQHIEPCLQALHASLFERRFASPLIEAAVAYVLVNWIHPFEDGNGRTSRIVFNALLSRGGLSPMSYLPIKEINTLALGGHTVRLRYCVATGEWEEIIEYFVNAIHFFHALTYPPTSTISHLSRDEANIR